MAELADAPPGTRSLPLPALDEVAVLPAAHPLVQQPVLAAQDFAVQPFISLARDDPYRQQIDAVFTQAGVERQLGLETASAVSVCAQVHVLLPLHRPAEPAVDALVAALQHTAQALQPSAG